MFDIIRIPALKDNYIWLLHSESSAIVVDPGDANPVVEILKQKDLFLEAILITHHHQDHQGGIAQLLKNYPADVYGPSAEPITALTKPVQGGETIYFQGLGTKFRVIATPGHTLGHVAYYGSQRLFCGDTLFGAGCGRVFEGAHEQMHGSLMQLAALPDETLIYSAHEYTEANLRFALAVEHGNRLIHQRADEAALLRAKGQATVPSILDLEKATNPFLRCDITEVIMSAQTVDVHANTPVTVFSILREWKNRF